MTGLLLSAVLASAPPSVTVKELHDRALVNLLVGLSIELEVGDEHAYELRALRDVRPGECNPTKPCTKDRLIVLVSTRDEYPEARGFQLLIPGEFRELAALTIPDTEDGAYRLVMRSSPSADDRVVCTSLVVTRQSMTAKLVPCAAREAQP